MSEKTITMYGISNCDTVKKAKRWLQDHDIGFEFHDYKKHGISKKQLEGWSKELGWEALLNRRGTTWRKLPEDTRESVNKKSAIDLMQQQPSMIKRPVIDYNGQLMVGFSEQEFDKQFAALT